MITLVNAKQLVKGQLAIDNVDLLLKYEQVAIHFCM